MNIKRFIINLLNRWKYRKINKYLPKYVDVKKATEGDLKEMGRTTYIHQKTNDGAVLTVGKTLVPIRNKKTGRVVMFSGTIETMKALYGDNYEMVDSVIKDTAVGAIDINADGFFGERTKQ